MRRLRRFEAFLTLTFTVDFFRPVGVSSITRWYYSNNYPLYISQKSNQDLVTVDVGGCVRLWETSLAKIERSIFRCLAKDGRE